MYNLVVEQEWRAVCVNIKKMVYKKDGRIKA